MVASIEAEAMVSLSLVEEDNYVLSSHVKEEESFIVMELLMMSETGPPFEVTLIFGS